jgi:hypothetical protein
LCLHHIPITAIIKSRNAAEVKRGKLSIANIYILASNLDQTEKNDGSNDIRMVFIKGDKSDYLGEYGDGDSDREMLQENYNTLVEKGIDCNC